MFWETTDSMLNCERALELNAMIRLILIVLVSMPQGWCCFVRVGESCCASLDSAPDHPPGKAPSCACCKIQQPTNRLTESTENHRDPFPGSCECCCRAQLGIPTNRPNVVVASLETCSMEPFRFESLGDFSPSIVFVRFYETVKLQILHCSWQC